MENDTFTVYGTTVVPLAVPASQLSYPLFWSTGDTLYAAFGIVLCGLVSVCGLVTNAIVMAVFYRQGIMSESSTVSLFSLALSDFLVQSSHITFGVTDSIAYSIDHGAMAPSHIEPWLPSALTFPSKITLSHIICWLTAYLSFERCFSVLFPFQVKRVFSPKNSLIAVMSVYAGSIFTFFPLISRLKVTTRIVNNKTMITLAETKLFSYEILNFAVLLNPIVLHSMGMSIVVLSNVLILIKVKSSKDWRKSATVTAYTSKDNSDNSNEKSKKAFQKERKLIKMISMISSIFVACTLPDMLLVILTQTQVAVFDDGATRQILYGFVFFAESINSSINMVVYYFMSTNFNKGVKELFRKDTK